VLRDEGLIEQARAEASRLVADDPDLSGHAALRGAVDALLDDERSGYLEKA
jgi:ATP-dependent DNA helicase RecG